MMDLMTVGIFSGCFVVVLVLVWLLSFLTKEQSYEDGLRQQKGGRLAALGVNKNNKEEGGKGKRQAKQQDKPAKAKKQAQQVRPSLLFKLVQENVSIRMFFCVIVEHPRQNLLEFVAFSKG